MCVLFWNSIVHDGAACTLRSKLFQSLGCATKSNKQWARECHVGMCMQGSKLFLNIGHAMTNDERWEGETGDLALRRFCPERWLTEAGARTGMWMPFGGGPRMCLGYLLATAEIKVPCFFAVIGPP